MENMKLKKRKEKSNADAHREIVTNRIRPTLQISAKKFVTLYGIISIVARPTNQLTKLL